MTIDIDPVIVGVVAAHARRASDLRSPVGHHTRNDQREEQGGSGLTLIIQVD